LSNDLRRIVYLFSDTGGGHRSAAQAIMEAMELEFPGQTSQEMVDIFGEYAPGILRRVPQSYPPLSRHPRILGMIFHFSDGAGRTGVFLRILWPFIRRSLMRMLRDHPAELFVSVHPLINAPLGQALLASASSTPFFTVVTDLVSTHATWFWKRSDIIIVPSEAARQRGMQHGFPMQHLRVIGLPVAERCSHPGPEDPLTIRRRLGWPEDRPVALLVGGGEGMGLLEQMAKAIDAAGLPLTLVIVAGRNEALKVRLEQAAWHLPTCIYGFTREMPDLMRAADILITKAGPGTISEALCAGLPMILYSRMDGAEEGNVNYVTGSGCGVYAPHPDQVVQALTRWLEVPEDRDQAAQACRAMARPEAARQIARLLGEALHLS
jgi:1,2-diacylglycerol 3-beta-galactosyltransferase